MSENKFNLRSTACSMHCSASREFTDSFYLDSMLPGAYLSDNTQTEASPVLEKGVFAVFSQLHPSEKSKVSIINEYKSSIINAGNAAVNACMEDLEEQLVRSKNYSFAMVKVKGDVAQIYYKGDCTVYIYRNHKVIPLTDINNKTQKQNNVKFNFTPEFKFVNNDAIILCTGGVKEKLSQNVLAHIMANTSGSKAAAQSIVLSANENHCVEDATAIVIRATEKPARAENKTPSPKSDIAETKVMNKPGNTTKEEKDDSQQQTNYNNFVVSGKNDEAKHLYNAVLNDEDDEDDAESYYLGLSKPAWVIIGILTAALGVIGGLIVLVL